MSGLATDQGGSAPGAGAAAAPTPGTQAAVDASDAANEAESSAFAEAFGNAAAGKETEPAKTGAGSSTDGSTTTTTETKPDAGTGAAAGASGTTQQPGGDATHKPAPTAPKNAAITEVDWSKVDPKVKAAYDAGSPEQQDITKGLLLESQNRGREIATLRTRISDTRRKPAFAGTLTAPNGAAKAKDTATQARKVLTGDAMKVISDELSPEVAEAVRQIVEPLVQGTESTAATLDGMSTETREQYFDAQEELLTELHPDWQKLTDAKFDAWVAEQPPHVKAMVHRQSQHKRIQDALEAADIMDRYKNHLTANTDPGDSSSAGSGGTKTTETAGTQSTSPVDGKRTRQLESAVAGTRTGIGGAASGTSEDDFSGSFKAATAAARGRETGSHA